MRRKNANYLGTGVVELLLYRVLFARIAMRSECLADLSRQFAQFSDSFGTNE